MLSRPTLPTMSADARQPRLVRARSNLRGGGRCSGQKQVWDARAWVASLDISRVIYEALKVEDTEVNEQEYLLGLEEQDLEDLLQDAGLKGLQNIMWSAIQELGNDCDDEAEDTVVSAKFQLTDAAPLSYNTISKFSGDLASIVGPVRRVEGSLMKAMEVEHCGSKDSEEKFTSSSGMTTAAKDEWEFVVKPIPNKLYPDLFPVKDPKRRKPRSLEELLKRMAEKNKELGQVGQLQLTQPEMVAAVLYTGPMYEKYNAVLRSAAGDTRHLARRLELCKDNRYPTTLHALSSCIAKLSTLSTPCRLWRGCISTALPSGFWERNEVQLKGGIELGFVSMTMDRLQALNADTSSFSTVFEARPGLGERGAELAWLSQYPHEEEVLFPPATGFEIIKSGTVGTTLVVEARLSVHFKTETLEEVLGRRSKIVEDLASNTVSEILAKSDPFCPGPAAAFAKAALECGPLLPEPRWYSDDKNFEQSLLDVMAILRDSHDLLRDHRKGQDLMDVLDSFRLKYRTTSASRLDLKGRIDSLFKLPEWLWSLSCMKEFEISGESAGSAKLRILPESLGKFERLERMVLHDLSELKALPNAISQLVHLEQFSLMRCSALTALPEGFSCLQRLRDLTIGHCGITSLPERFGELPALKELALVGCRSLQVLPDSFGGLSALTTLVLVNNGLRSLPETMGSMEALVKLDLRACKYLAALPESIGGMRSLKELALAFCESLERLPEAFGRLRALELLNLERAGIRVLPASLGSLESLRVLYLRGCLGLESLPESLGSLQALERLDLVNASVRALPPSIGKMASLKDLVLRCSFHLTVLPQSFGKLSAIEHLDLHCSGITALPETLGMARTLKVLNLCWCKHLKSLPESIGGLVFLEELILKGSQVELLPISMGNLVSLRLLNLESCTSLTDIPSELLLLRRLDDLRLDGSGIGGHECGKFLQKLRRHQTLPLASKARRMGVRSQAETAMTTTFSLPQVKKGAAW